MLVRGTRPPTRSDSAATGGGILWMEELPLLVFGLLAEVPGGYRAVVSHNPSPDFTAYAFVVLQCGSGLLVHAVAPWVACFFSRMSSSQRGQNSCSPLR